MPKDYAEAASNLRSASRNISGLADILETSDSMDLDESALASILKRLSTVQEESVELLRSVFIYRYVESSNLQEVSHNSSTNCLRVVFKNGEYVYEYDNVPRSIYEELLRVV